MRIPKPVDCQDLGQLLASGTCPVCTFLRNYQSACLYDLRPSTAWLCSFHLWAAVSASPGETICDVLAKMLASAQRSQAPRPQCDICEQIRAEEGERVDELIRRLDQRVTAEWMQKQGTVCIAHGIKMIAAAPAAKQALVMRMLDRNSEELRQVVAELRGRLAAGHHQGAGILGRVAEFLVSQRGLPV